MPRSRMGEARHTRRDYEGRIGRFVGHTVAHAGHLYEYSAVDEFCPSAPVVSVRRLMM